MSLVFTSKANNGKKALVITTDYSRYERLKPGEPTQGAGAVAFLVSDQDNIVSLDLETGNYSKDAPKIKGNLIQCSLHKLALSKKILLNLT